MSTADRLAASLASTDLAWHAIGTGDVEYVAALGYIGIRAKTASSIFRLIQTLDPSSYPGALQHAVSIVRRLNSVKRWNLQGMEFQRLGQEALEFFLLPVCPKCFGRKYKLIPGSDRHLSDKECPHCKGSGIRPLKGADRTRIKDIAAALDENQGRVIGGVRNRLKEG